MGVGFRHGEGGGCSACSDVDATEATDSGDQEALVELQ